MHILIYHFILFYFIYYLTMILYIPCIFKYFRCHDQRKKIIHWVWQIYVHLSVHLKFGRIRSKNQHINKRRHCRINKQDTSSNYISSYSSFLFIFIRTLNYKEWGKTFISSSYVHCAYHATQILMSCLTNECIKRPKRSKHTRSIYQKK